MAVEKSHTSQAYKIIVGSGHILGGTLICTILGGVQGFIIAGMLGPSLYGIWNILKIIFTYNANAHLGLLDGMNKQMPYLRGQGHHDLAERIKDNAFWAVLGLTITLNVILILANLMVKGLFPTNLPTPYLCILAVTNILFQVYITYSSLLRTDLQFRTQSHAMIVFSLASLVLTVMLLLILPDKIQGVLLAALIAYLLACVFIYFRARYRFTVRFNMTLLRETFKIGLPIILIQIFFIIFITIDRWMIAGFIDEVKLGFYSIGLYISTLLYGSASTIAFTLYPFMLERYGKSNIPRESESLVYIPVMALSYIMSIMCAVIALVTPFFITYVLPAYIPGINAAIILVWGTFFISIMLISSNYLVSINKQMHILYGQLAAIPLCAILDYVFIKSGFSIAGVSFATTISYFCYGTGITMMAMQHFTSRPRDLFLKLGKIYFPFIISFAIYYALSWGFPIIQGTFMPDLVRTSAQLVIFSGVALLLMMHLNKHSGVLSLVKEIVFARLRAI